MDKKMRQLNPKLKFLRLAGLISVITLLLLPARLASAQTVGLTWKYTGNLISSEDAGTMTLLPNGKVLIVGRNAELYEPTTGTWSSTGSLNTERGAHTATLLANGKVLVAGGYYNNSLLNTAELYDPATGMWSITGNLNTARMAHTATLLSDGMVLVAGGYYALNSTELYDPATGMWSNTGNLNTARVDHTATLLSDGKVLVAGGYYKNSPPGNNAELYDPANGTWSITGNLNTGRDAHTATLLPNGKVLVAGGFDVNHSLNSSELYDPATGTWSGTGNLNTARCLATATLLPSGKVLVAAGSKSCSDDVLSDAELYDPTTGMWSYTGSLNTARVFNTMTLLRNGKVLVAGGYDYDDDDLNSTELYDSDTNLIPNQIDDAQFFVRQHYRDFLNREPDADGLAFWTNEIASCGSDRQCLDAKRINVSAAYFLSIEFQQTGYLVYRIYRASYGNLPGAPVPVKLSEFQLDTQKIGQGVVVNQPGWESVLENSKQTFMSEFVQRSAFVSAYTTSITPAAFVDQLFANAGVTPSATDRNAAMAEFGTATNTSDVTARSRALRDVAENSILNTQEFNRAFVLMQFFGYLRRDPNNGPDTDYTGYDFWLTKLNQFNGNYNAAEMVKAFITSTEYRQRFGP